MVTVFRKILFATDLTENSRYAFSFAASIASYCNGKITILHVMEKNPINVEYDLAAFLGDEKWQELKKIRKAKQKTFLSVRKG